MHYKCKFCTYETNIRKQIHIHHIIPKEANGTNDKYNTVYLCPNHHHKIYSKYAKSGIHSIKTEDSIEIIAYRNNGKFLEIKINDETHYIE